MFQSTLPVVLQEQLLSLRYSSWHKCLRVQAYISRFANNAALPSADRKCGELDVDELDQAEMDIIRSLQSEVFEKEYGALVRGDMISKQSKLLCLNPKLDENGVMRCDGRLTYAEMLPYDVRYPIILPRKAWVTKLIVKYYHELGNHVAGTNQTLCSLSAKYWILCG